MTLKDKKDEENNIKIHHDQLLKASDKENILNQNKGYYIQKNKEQMDRRLPIINVS